MAEIEKVGQILSEKAKVLKENGTIVLYRTKDEPNTLILGVNISAKKGVKLYQAEQKDDIVIIHSDSVLDKFDIVFDVLESALKKDITRSKYKEPKPCVITSVFDGTFNEQKEIHSYMEKKGFTFEFKACAPKVFKCYSNVTKEHPEFLPAMEENKKYLASIGASWKQVNNQFKQAIQTCLMSREYFLMLTGDPGTGKTIAAQLAADYLNTNIRKISITPGVKVVDLIGQFVPNTKGGPVVKLSQEEFNKIKNLQSYLSSMQKQLDSSGAKYVFEPGPLMVSYELPEVCFIDELKNGTQSVLASFNCITDGSKEFAVGNRIFKRNPNWILITAFNAGMGEQFLPSFTNRAMIVNFPSLTEQEICERMKGYCKAQFGRTPSETFFKYLNSLGLMIATKGKTLRENIQVSVRNMQRVCDIVMPNQVDEGGLKNALCMAYINALSINMNNQLALENYINSAEVKNLFKNIYGEYTKSYSVESNKIVNKTTYLEEEEKGAEEAIKKEETETAPSIEGVLPAGFGL